MHCYFGIICLNCKHVNVLILMLCEYHPHRRCKDSETLWAFRQNYFENKSLHSVKKKKIRLLHERFHEYKLLSSYNQDKKRTSLSQKQISTFPLRSLHSLNVVQTSLSQTIKRLLPVLILCDAINAPIIIQHVLIQTVQASI